jgi:RHS repeat-associated protein
MLINYGASDNHPPVAVDDSFTVHCCAGLNVTANDSDPDNEVFFITDFPSTTAHGALFSVGNGVLNYTANYGYVGTDSFAYQICDPQHACASATVTLNVVNQPPIGRADSFSFHVSGIISDLTANDSDPDGEGVTCGDRVQQCILTLPQHGTLYGVSPTMWSYTPTSGYTGSDSFTYNACDGLGLCTETTVNIAVVNQPPNGGADSFTIHGYGIIDGLLLNDSDPDGDAVSCGQSGYPCIVTLPQHGFLFGIEPDRWSYTPTAGYTGTDSFTYNVCDGLGLCTPTNVSISVVNHPPVAENDSYIIRGTTTIGPLRASDPDQGDTLSAPAITSGPAHGTLTSLADPNLKNYQPTQGYFGDDSFVFQVCDNIGACSSATISLKIIANDGRENCGDDSCKSRVGSVGEPVNITNGNMYLQQTDYQLPGVGPVINILRTYNSISPDIGLFGKGWSSDYDESIKVYNSNYVRWYRADGQATNFMRASGSGPFAPVEGDFYGSVIQNVDGTFTVSFKDGSVHRFNAAGKLTALVDRESNQTSLTYDTSSRLISITDPFGRVLTVTPDLNGRVSSLRDALATVATYAYGSNGELLSVTYPDSSAFHFAYTTANGKLVLATVTDALGNILETHAYDSQGRAVTSEKQGGVERYTLSFVSSSETDATDALGHVTKYFFDGSKGRNTVTSVQGLCSCGGGSQTQSWTYDDQLNMTTHTNALGQVATYTYDANGNQLSATGVLGTSSFTYNQFSEVLTATDAMSGVTTNTFDAAGNLLSAQDALNNTTSFTYDSRGQLLTMTNALGKTTTLTWDTSGRLTQTKDALANITTFTYDARARLTKATDALANATSFAYDAANRLIKITRADNSVISYTYDLAGRRTKVTDPLKHVTTFAYDGAYRLTGETDALSKSVSHTYDVMSNLTGTTDQLGQTTNIVYDEFNRPTTTTYPPAVAGGARLQQTIEYDAVGNVTKRTDTAGRVTTFAYDSANRITSVTDPVLQVTQYEYNPRSNVTAVVDALSQRYEFVYDALSRATSATRAGLQMSFAYDAVGNRIQRTDYNNATTNYTYDALNRLTKTAYPDTTTATYAYDKLSRLTSAINLNGTVSFVYDKLGRVTSTTDVWAQAINYTYDVNGRRTKMSFGSTTKATYTYDAINRLTKIADGSNLATNYAYDTASRLTSRTLPNGVVTSYSYDGLDRLTRLKDAKSTTVIADNNYTYNDAGNIIQNIDQSGTHAYGYDTLDRLTSASYPATGNESYAYDTVGNRTSSHRSASYGYQPFNRLTNTDTAGYLYDNNSNMITKSDGAGTTHFAWDFENRLTQVVTPSSGSATYKYDALGRRVQSAPSTGVSTNFTYDGDDVAQDKTSTGVITEYLNGPGVDNKIRQKTGTTLNYFAQDHLGSTTALTDSNGALVERETHDAYGNSSGSARTRYGYTGRERDSNTGLQYNRARWYDPQVGRFISEDPLGLGGGINSFAYVSNNPQNKIDPSGLYDIDVHYYLTYYLAMKTGCFKDSEAREIAEGDQHSDEDSNKKPGWGKSAIGLPFGGGIIVDDPDQRERNVKFHAFGTPEQNAARAAELLSQASQGGGNPWAFGTYLHFLQDSYSHSEYAGNDTWGQVSGGNSADHTSFEKGKAMDMALDTYNKLARFGEQRGCRCHGDPDWHAVRRFIDVGYDDSLLGGLQEVGRGVSNPQLRLKIQILGVPWRSPNGR